MANKAITLVIPMTRDSSGALIKKLKPGDTLIVKSVAGIDSVHTEPTEHQGKETPSQIEVSLTFIDSELEQHDSFGVAIVDTNSHKFNRLNKLEHFYREHSKGNKESEIKFGKHPVEKLVLFDTLRDQWRHGEISIGEFCQKLGISRSSFRKWVNENENQVSSGRLGEARRRFKRERIIEGVAVAKAKGVKFGRRTKKEVDPAYFDILREEWLRGRISGKEAAERLGISSPTFFTRVGHVQGGGVAAAKSRGLKFGRKPLERPNSFEYIREAWRHGEITAKEAGRRLGVCGATFKNWASESMVAAD